jgi:phosphomannomutase
MSQFFFDVDGVLCDTGCKIDDDFKTWFLDWAVDKEYYLVTGGERQATIEQIGIEIVERAKIGFHCMGNHIWIGDRDYKINQFILHDNERLWLEEAVSNSRYHTKTGNHIELRQGSVNFSIVGRNATAEQRNEYLIWDNDTKERLTILQLFKKQFPRFDIYIGGNTSIDICLRGANKSQVIDLTGNYSRDESYFFGDKCFFNGIDFPISSVIRNTFRIQNGYNQTKEILSKL